MMGRGRLTTRGSSLKTTLVMSLSIAMSCTKLFVSKPLELMEMIGEGINLYKK